MKNVVVVDENGTKRWYKNGFLHREDGPAVEFANGSKLWHINNKPHRENGPAIEWFDDTKWQRLNKKIKRAIKRIFAYFKTILGKSKNGFLDRKDGYAVENPAASKYWYINGLLHREDGPAVEKSDGTKAWFINHKCHREDGPALEWADGSKYWYINGRECSQEEFNQYLLIKKLAGLK